MVAMLVMPRLPTPIATRAPGFSREAKGAADNSFRTVAGMSRMLRSGKFWRTSRRRENCIALLYPRHAKSPAVFHWPLADQVFAADLESGQVAEHGQRDLFL